MPVTFVKAKAKVESKATPVSEAKVVQPKDAIKEAVDNYGSLSSLIAEYKTHASVLALLKAEEDLKKEKERILSLADTLYKEDEDTTVVGNKYAASIGAKANKSEIKEEGGKEAIFEILGEETFFNLCDFKLGDLRKYITEDQLSAVLTTSRSGARSLKLK